MKLSRTCRKKIRISCRLNTYFNKVQLNRTEPVRYKIRSYNSLLFLIINIKVEIGGREKMLFFRYTNYKIVINLSGVAKQ